MVRFTVILGLCAAWGQSLAAQTGNCDDAVDMVSIYNCVQAQYEEADRYLNDAYQQAMADMQSIDATLPKSEQGAATALKAAQRAWITVRDSTCAAEGFHWVGGSGRGLAVLSCMLNETQARSGVLAGLAQYE